MSERRLLFLGWWTSKEKKNTLENENNNKTNNNTFNTYPNNHWIPEKILLGRNLKIWKEKKQKKTYRKKEKSIQNIVWCFCFLALPKVKKKPVEIFDEIIKEQEIEKWREKARERERERESEREYLKANTWKKWKNIQRNYEIIVKSVFGSHLKTKIKTKQSTEKIVQKVNNRWRLFCFAFQLIFQSKQW